ncbi:MAG: DUF3616 domain-containing protein [Chthoniobacteraceae bacterium]
MSIFATAVRVNGDEVEITPLGQPNSTLLDDLLSDPRLARYDLEKASRLAPKDTGGLNIEGLASTPEGHLLIGFRNPVRAGKTLVVPLLNPLEVIEGGKAKLGAAIELDLQGLGIRSVKRIVNRYIIIVGATDSGTTPAPVRVGWPGECESQRGH